MKILFLSRSAYKSLFSTLENHGMFRLSSKLWNVWNLWWDEYTYVHSHSLNHSINSSIRISFTKWLSSSRRKYKTPCEIVFWWLKHVLRWKINCNIVCTLVHWILILNGDTLILFYSCGNVVSKYLPLTEGGTWLFSYSFFFNPVKFIEVNLLSKYAKWVQFIN